MTYGLVIENFMDRGSKMTKIEEAIFKEANNVLYFDDNSDYKSALWDILLIIKPDLDTNEELVYIDEGG